MSAVRESYRAWSHLLPPVPETAGRYELGFATTPDELDSVFRLRYSVFNLELNEGLEQSHETGRDVDVFDRQCLHLVVRDRTSGKPVGTYRLQTRQMALTGRGFYTATEFDLSTLPDGLLEGSVEIGRACIALEHRSLQVLYLLWQGLGSFVAFNACRYLFGCCSLTSQDPHEATRVYQRLDREGFLDPTLRVRPHSSHACLVPSPEPGPDHMPRLMKAYLSLGAVICSEPALDSSFGTIDYMALFDLTRMESSRLAFFQSR